MGPRKKARFLAPPVTGAQLAGSIAADSAVAQSIASVPALQRSVCQCVELIYQVRHGVTIDIDSLPDVSDTLSETKSASGAPSLSERSSGIPEIDEFGFLPVSHQTRWNVHPGRSVRTARSPVAAVRVSCPFACSWSTEGK